MLLYTKCKIKISVSITPMFFNVLQYFENIPHGGPELFCNINQLALDVHFPAEFSSNPNQTPEQANHGLQDCLKVTGR